MAKHVEDLTVGILKGMHAALAAHSKCFDRIVQRFEGSEDHLDEINEGMSAALGLASHTPVRDDSIKNDINDLKRRLKRLEGKI